MKYTSINKVLADKISGEWGVEPEDDSWVKVIRTANFTNFGVIDYSNIVLRKIESKKVELKKLISGDVIIEKSGGSPTQPVGRVVYFENPDNSIYLCNNFTTVLRPNKSKVFPKYLFYVLFYNHLTKRTLRFQNKTTGIINLKLEKYLKSEIPLPPLEDQIRIATVLTRAEKLIAKRKESIETLNELLKSTFLEMFGDPIRNEKGWEELSINNIITDIKSGTSYSGEEKKELTDDELGVLKISAVTQGIFNPAEYKAVKISAINKEIIKVKKGMFLFSRANTKELVAACCIVNQDYPKLFLPDKLWAFTIDKNAANPTYLNYLLKNEGLRNLLRKKASGGHDSMLNISMQKFRSLEIPKPPLPLQDQFAALAERVETINEKYTRSLTELENLYASLSQRAYNGELDLSKVQLEKENEIIEIQGEVRVINQMAGDLTVSPIYSQAELRKIIQSQKGETFSFDTLMTMLQKSSFEEMPEYEDIKNQIYEMLKGANPLLSQSFDKVKKEIVLRINL